ncbi:MAG: glycosyltransferase family 2 protein [Propionibacteriaceae bacterium]
MTGRRTVRLPTRSPGADRVGPPTADPAQSFGALVVAFVVFATVGTVTWLSTRGNGPLDTYLAVVWSLPLGGTIIGLSGALRSRRSLREARPERVERASEQLIVVIPTVGRRDVLPALSRVIATTSAALPLGFTRFRIDLVIEENCAVRGEIEDLASADPWTHVVVVPASYQTPERTHFKARANHYANAVRTAEGEIRDDVWILHMDDDTDLRPDAVLELARFLHENRRCGDALDLAQGILCYPRELASSRLVWLADAVRPGCDISIFAATTGRGSPYAGLHGEMLLVRSSIEAVIGWDFGPRTIVEDAQFALHFCSRYPGRSGWIAARSYGASPATPGDLIRQRERWVWGLLELVSGRSQRFTSSRDSAQPSLGPSRRHGLLMLHNTFVWACAPLGHPVVIVLCCVALRDLHTSPPLLALVPVWALNAAYGVWLYWEGLKINSAASALPRRRWWEPPCLLILSPMFTLWEVAGIARGVARFVRGGEPCFTVIAKPV